MTAFYKREIPSSIPTSFQSKQDFKVRPRGEIDYDALHNTVAKRFPKVLARLAE